MFKLTEPQEAWLTALESGDYQQTKSTLKRSSLGQESFCCLGVACDLAVKADMGEWSPSEIRPEVYRFHGLNYGDSGIADLPQNVQDWLGMGSGSGHTLDDNRELGLVVLNDRIGHTFKEIAAIIRANPENYFYKP